jgi:hypothetical protein
MSTISYSGFTTGQMRLSNRTYFTEPNGLERIEDNYILQNSFLKAFQALAVLGTQNATIMGYCSDINETTYGTMTIERVDYSNIGGNLTSARVTYVGLHSTQTPRPLIYIDPILDLQYCFNAWTVSVEFITYLGDSGSVAEIDAVTKKFSGTNGINLGYINGYKIPNSTQPPTSISSQAFFSIPTLNVGWLSCSRTHMYGKQDSNVAPCETNEVYGTLGYYGMCVSSFNIIRFGLYAQINITWQDSAYYFIPFTVYNCDGDSTVQQFCRQGLNFNLPELGNQ